MLSLISISIRFFFFSVFRRGRRVIEPRERHFCPRCGSSFSKKSNMLTHYRHECGKEPRFQCPYCGKKDRKSSNTYRHIRMHHKGSNIHAYRLYWTKNSLTSELTRQMPFCRDAGQVNYQSSPTTRSSRPARRSSRWCRKGGRYPRNLQRRVYFLHISLARDSSVVDVLGHDNKISNTATLSPFFLKTSPVVPYSLGEPVDILFVLLGPRSTLLLRRPRASLRLWWHRRDPERSLRLRLLLIYLPFYRVACYVLFCSGHSYVTLVQCSWSRLIVALLLPVRRTIPAAIRRPHHGHLEGELRWQPERGQARKRTLLAVWENGVSLSQMQRRLYLQEDAEDPHEVRLREGAEVQVPLLQQKGQVLVEYLQAH